MNVDVFTQQLQEIHWRLAEMYRGASASVHPQADILPSAFKELGVASEELQVASEEMLQQMEELITLRSQLETERQRYQDLFEFMPNAYLVTDANGKIQEANRAAAALLNVETSQLISKLLISFIPVQDRREFRFKLNQLQEYDWVQEWMAKLQPRNGEILDVALTVAATRDAQCKVISIRWILRDISKRKQALKVL
ncbi:MAG: PAS domain S-box protein, partial [Coleofasciculus sp. S288]|nr:PAS domain S-box protein [Coleofasciculus sp. S288]